MYGGPKQYHQLQDPVQPLGPGLEFDEWVRLDLLSSYPQGPELKNSVLTISTTLCSGSEVRKSGMLLRRKEKLRFSKRDRISRLRLAVLPSIQRMEDQIQTET